MLGGVDAIEDNRNMRKEFGDNIESTLRVVVSQLGILKED